MPPPDNCYDTASKEAKPKEPKKPKTRITLAKPLKHRCFLVGGLCVLDAQKKKNQADLIKLTITDYAYSARVVLDSKKKQLLPNQFGLTLTPQNIEQILTWMEPQ